MCKTLDSIQASPVFIRGSMYPKFLSGTKIVLIWDCYWGVTRAWKAGTPFQPSSAEPSSGSVGPSLWGRLTMLLSISLPLTFQKNPKAEDPVPLYERPGHIVTIGKQSQKPLHLAQTLASSEAPDKCLDFSGLFPRLPSESTAMCLPAPDKDYGR